jgi:hypothetical protein
MVQALPWLSRNAFQFPFVHLLRLPPALANPVRLP